MEWSSDPSDLFNGLGGSLVVALGVWVALLRPRGRANLALAAFLIGFGAFSSPGYFVVDLSPSEDALYDAWRLAAQLTGASGIIALLAIFPQPLTRKDAPGIALAGVVLAIALVANSANSLAGGWSTRAYAQLWPSLRLLEVLERLSNDLLFASLTMAPVLLTWRYGRLDNSAARTQAALMSSALLVYVGFLVGAGGSEGANPVLLADSRLVAIPRALAVGIVGLLWLRWTTTSGEPARARNLALLAFGMPLLGLFYLAAGKGFGGYGIVRTLFVLVLAYAILRSQLLGLDVKVRLAISKSTIAAVFIAVFFIASEAAQQFFGDQFESGYLGILAAGALVFAIAPLSRVADRLAEKAVPVAAAPVAVPSVGAVEGRRAVFADAVRRSLRDGAVTREEETYLARLATELGLDYATALGIRHDVEAERTAGGQ